MRIIADRDRCVGAGQCVLQAPTIFEQSEDDGLVVLLEQAPDEETEPAVRDAVALCPADVLTLVEE